jgi:hypothetical protein
MVRIFTNRHGYVRLDGGVIDEEDGTASSSALDRETEAGDVHAPSEDRVIFINRTQPAVSKFVNNRISTAKYR